MKIKLGIVGPEDSVKRIVEIAKEIDDKLIIFPFTYQDITEVKSIIKQNKETCDVWIFSGQAPYSMAVEEGLYELAFFPSLNGSSLMKTLFYITYHDKRDLNNMSLDTISESDVKESFTELQVPMEGTKLFPYSGHIAAKTLIDFHYNLFKQNKTSFAVTCVNSVYNQLKALDVPVYRVTPTKLSIKQTVNESCKQKETNYFRQSQIATIIIQTYDSEKIIQDNKLLTHNHRLNLKLQELIIDFSETLLGSYIYLSDGRFIIFSTRGLIEKYKDSTITTLLDKASLITNIKTNMGIGYGKTATEAEKNAYTAFLHARDYEMNCSMLVDEFGNIEGPLKEKESITYNSRNENEVLEEQLKKAGVNISTFNKIIYVQNNYCNHTISSTEIAELLHMSQRNARRILSSLEKVNLAKRVGKESPIQKGRPKNIYQVSEYLH